MKEQQCCQQGDSCRHRDLLSAAEKAGTAAGRDRLEENSEPRCSSLAGVAGDVGVSGMNGFGPGFSSSSPGWDIHRRVLLVHRDQHCCTSATLHLPGSSSEC